MNRTVFLHLKTGRGWEAILLTIESKLAQCAIEGTIECNRGSSGSFIVTVGTAAASNPDSAPAEDHNWRKSPWKDETSSPWWLPGRVRSERQPWSTRRSQLAQIQSSQTWQPGKVVTGQIRTCCTSNYHQMLPFQKIVWWSQQKPWKRWGQLDI